MRRERHVVLVVTLVALVLRLAWVLVLQRGGFPANDALNYHLSGASISLGHGYASLGGTTAQWPPGYSALLGALYWMFGISPTHGEVLNAVIGAATVPLVYLLVRPQFGRRAATIAAVLMCCMPGLIFWTDMLVSETLVTLLFVVFFILASRSRPTWGWAIALGAVAGLSAMVRSEAPLWLLVPMVIWWFGSGWKVSLSRVALAAVAVVMVLTPWTVRNSTVFHSFVPLSLNSGLTLWSGHNAMADGAQTYPPDDLLELVEGTLEGPARELAVADYFRHDAIQYALHHPVREATLIPRKIVALFRGDSYSFDWINQQPYPVMSPGTQWFFGTLADMAWFALFGLCLAGIVGLGRRVWRTPLMLGIATSFVTALVLYGFVYFGNYRYHVPYEPLMIVVASVVLERAWTCMRETRRRDEELEASEVAAAELASAEPIASGADWSPGGESNS